MRTTLTLDDDVAALVRREISRRKRTLKEIVNDGLRAGLAPAGNGGGKRRPYRIRRLIRGRLLVDVDCVERALAHAEGEGHR